jgi:aldehyde:ferredoxin oxidoreductase
MTGSVKESNAGGTTGMRMVWLGLKALILEGGPPSDNSWKVLYINAEGARLEPAEDLLGLGLKDTAERLIERFDQRIGISAIGPGGERGYLAAGVTHIDKDRNLTRISARGGLGAVMGSKHLKAIVFDQSRSNKPPLVNEPLFIEASQRYLKGLHEHPQIETYKEFGTAAMVNMCNTFGAMPTRNFSAGSFDGAEEISGETIRDLNQARGGEISHACMPGCTIRCSNCYAGPDGETLVTPLEYETLGLMGSNLGIDDPDCIARLNDIANDIGVDTIDVGAALGIAADTGLMEFGDSERALQLMEEIEQGTPLGRDLGNGAAHAARAFGTQRAPIVKGQAFSAYDPRAIKGTGVTYATSPQGADHTCGLTIRAKINHLDAKGQVEVSRNGQYNMAAYDTLGVCAMGTFGFSTDITIIPDLINGQYDWGVGEDYLRKLGRKVILMEREFNTRAGFTKEEDRLPDWMKREKLPPHNSVFDVPDGELDTIFETP